MISDTPREEALEKAKNTAKAEALQSGAKADTIEIVELNEIAVSYLPGNLVCDCLHLLKLL